MADGSHIEWTDATWNPVTGCSIVSPGCTNCYAMKLAGTRLKNIPSRAGLTVPSKSGPVWNGQVRLNEEWLDQPLRWSRPRMIFVCAHGDLFAENVPDEWIDRVFAVMALSPQHTFQVLTKRAKRMRDYMTKPHRAGRSQTILDDGTVIDTPAANVRIHSAMCDLLPTVPLHALNAAAKWQDDHFPGEDGFIRRWPLPNVWLGVSAERQKEADERVPQLLATPAAIRFVSAEPLLGPIDLLPHMFIYTRADDAQLDRRDCNEPLPFNDPATTEPAEIATPRLDWIIVGGESGHGARPMHPAWARRLRDDCAAAQVPFFFKQWGAWHDADAFLDEIEAGPGTIFKGGAAWQPARPLNYTDAASLAEMTNHQYQFNSDGTTSLYRSKKNAGRLLDGVAHNGMPQAREVPAL